MNKQGLSVFCCGVQMKDISRTQLLKNYGFHFFVCECPMQQLLTVLTVFHFYIPFDLDKN